MAATRGAGAVEDVLRAHSQSFGLAARLLGRADRGAVAALYAWCRRVDDAIDLAPPDEQQSRLGRLQRELLAVYRGSAQSDPVLAAFQHVVFERQLPGQYPDALLEGMAMDVQRVRYASLDELYGYCWRVAGVVGIMACHLFGISDAGARRPAAQLGMAMQLTNVCRDVVEDWERGRLYLPADVLASAGAPNLAAALGRPLPVELRRPLALAVERVLTAADDLYRLADTGMPCLPFRAGLAVRSARRIYAEIGVTLRARGCDVFRGRAVVPARRKLRLVLGALASALSDLPQALRFERAALPGIVEFPRDVLG